MKYLGIINNQGVQAEKVLDLMKRYRYTLIEAERNAERKFREQEQRKIDEDRRRELERRRELDRLEHERHEHERKEREKHEHERARLAYLAEQKKMEDELHR